MNVLKPEKQLAVVSHLVEGVSVRSIERLTGVHRDTILRLLVRVGERCPTIRDETVRGIHDRVERIVRNGLRRKVLRVDRSQLLTPLLMGMVRGLMLRERYGGRGGELTPHVHSVVDFFLRGASRP